MQRIVMAVNILILLGALTTAQANSEDPKAIIKKCIERHGGWKKFSDIRDIYAKMKVRTFSKEGDVESTFHEYFRKPDKLRIEIHPPMEPPAIIGWDGKYIWQLVDKKLEKTDKPEQVERIKESLRFVKLMILTNLLNPGSVLNYEAYKKKKTFGIHVITQTDRNGEKVRLYISDHEYKLLGAQFYSRSDKSMFEVVFTKHQEFGGMYLPRSTKLYRKNKMIMEAKLSWVKTNAIQNGNSFFSDLNEKAKLQKKQKSYRRFR